MAKQSMFLLLLMLLLTTTNAQIFKTEKWAISRKTQQKTTTNLQFYFHDTLSGKNPSAVKIAQGKATNESPTLFGLVMMADDPLTETPDPNSKLLGRAQGLYASSCKEELGLLMALSYNFVDGIYNGSSITIVGKNLALRPVREMPVVGGTGLFRMARGYAMAKTHWFNSKTGDVIVGYNVTIVH